MARRSLPNGKAEAILAALRKKSPQAPGELADALGIARSNLAYRLKPLVKAGSVVAAGSTNNRRYSLPGKTAAKEGL